MGESAIERQLGEPSHPDAYFYFPDEPFDPMPGVYRSSVGSQAIFLCYGRAVAHLGKGPDSEIAIVMLLEAYSPDRGDGHCLAIKARETTQFMTREQWNDKAFVRIGPIVDGLREIGWG